MGALALTGLSACAAGPELLVEQAPSQALALSGVHKLVDDSDTKALNVVSRILTDAYDVTAGEEWHLVATLSRRPVEVGTFSDRDAHEGAWTETPRIIGAHRGPGLHVLTVVATRSDGNDKRMARVSARGPLSETGDTLLELMAAAAAKALVEGRVGD